MLKICNFQKDQERNYAHKKTMYFTENKSVRREILNKIAENIEQMHFVCFLLKQHNALRNVYVFSGYELTMKKCFLNI